MSGYKLVPGKYPSKPVNTENEFFKNGWSIKTENGRFFMNYISGSIQGEFKTIEISEEDFYLSKDDKITFDELCTKYKIS